MKRYILVLFFILNSIYCLSQIKFVDASSLNLIGKAKPTSQFYHRIDTTIYKGFTKGENQQVRCSAGLALVFKTNSSTIVIDPKYTEFARNATNSTKIATDGFDLYIKNNGKWLYAMSGVGKKRNEAFSLISNMDKNEKECLLYLPNYSELTSLKIGVDESSMIIPIENPFRHKILIFGSSFTHGIGTSRAGMSYPMQIERNTGLHFCNIACSGNSKLQPYFADYICDIKDADAIVFDGFSNPSASMIEERLFPFIERIRKKLPNTPLIFVKTIYREVRNFDMVKDKAEKDKIEMSDKLMKIAVKKYNDVYYINPKSNLTENDHITSVDGVHPSDLGYWRWANNLQPYLLAILKKYNIR